MYAVSISLGHLYYHQFLFETKGALLLLNLENSLWFWSLPCDFLPSPRCIVALCKSQLSFSALFTICLRRTFKIAIRFPMSLVIDAFSQRLFLLGANRANMIYSCRDWAMFEAKNVPAKTSVHSAVLYLHLNILVSLALWRIIQFYVQLIRSRLVHISRPKFMSSVGVALVSQGRTFGFGGTIFSPISRFPLKLKLLLVIYFYPKRRR